MENENYEGCYFEQYKKRTTFGLYTRKPENLDLKQKNAKPTTDYRQSYRHKQYFDGFSVTDLVVRITLKLEMLILSRPLSLGINPARH